MKKLGFIINPIAGMGGRVGLKGTDGEKILQQARQLGAKPQAPKRALESLRKLLPIKNIIKLITYPQDMGEHVARECGFSPTVIGALQTPFTTAKDTQNAAKEMKHVGVDLLLFAGGDGTARDICQTLHDSITILGIPAGVKIHSAVFATNPEKAGELASLYLQKKNTTIIEAEVMDLNEEDYRQGVLSARIFGYLKIPFHRKYLQNKKTGSLASEKYYQAAIAAAIVEKMEKNMYYIIGPGTTTRSIMQRLNLNYTLIGVDVIQNQKLIGKDLNESQLLNMIQNQKSKLIITPIGGQGYLLGRGNQQISSEVLKRIGKENLIIAATPQKIHALMGRPLLVDTGDITVNESMNDYFRIITGYGESIIYKVTF